MAWRYRSSRAFFNAKSINPRFRSVVANEWRPSKGAFEAEGIHNIGFMQSNHPRTNPLANVQVASVATLARRDISPDPVRPDVDVALAREVALAPGLVFVPPRSLQVRDGRGRQGGFVAQVL